jgi:hypothetical protein
MTRNFLALGLCFAAALLMAQPAARGEVIVTPVGTPIFEVVDTHIYTAPTDRASFEALFPNHFPTRIAHGPPYDQEFTEGLAITGYAEKEVFTVEDFTSPNAVHFGFVLVPGSNAPQGSSFDFANGPIISNGILPIAVRGDVYLNGALFEQNAFGFNLPPDSRFDGDSHFVVDLWENSAFAPPGLSSLIGDYEYRVTLRDASGVNGFDAVAKFQVVPEPGALTLFGLGAIAVVGCVWRRKTLARQH